MCLASLILGGTLPLALSAQPAPVQQVPGQCIYPPRPLLDEASLHALGLTMGEELSRYMNDAQAYTQCLDATKQQLNEEISRYLEHYQQTNSDRPNDALINNAE